MGMVTQYRKEATLTAGSDVDIALHADPTLVRTIVVVSGRTTGTLTLTKKAVGATRFTAFVPAATIDLTSVDEIVIEGAGLSELNIADGGSGADLTITVTQMSI